MLRTVAFEMFNRNANGVRAHAAGDGVKQPNVSRMAARGVILKQATYDRPLRACLDGSGVLHCEACHEN